MPNSNNAIEVAIQLAGKNDVVGVFGKVHVKSMCYGKKEYQWDEFEIVKAAIKKRTNESTTK